MLKKPVSNLKAAKRGQSGKVETNGKKKPIERYEHTDKKRANNPPVGLVTPETDKDSGRKIYAFDPHLDPRLEWAGKKEHTSFEVPTVSLHVHERIDPKTIVGAVKAKNGISAPRQMGLFEAPEQNPPLREALDFYKHPHGWSNRLIAGDSLLVMSSLLEKEGMGSHVQMVFIDPPYGIKYGSNFQPFVHRRDVKDGKDLDLTQEPEMIRAFRDTWELGIHSYLTYLRDRLLLAKDLLHESGSCFVQISDENVHLVRNLLDEVFGVANFGSLIAFQKTTGSTTSTIPRTCDYLLWYAKDLEKLKFRKLYLPQTPGEEGAKEYKRVELQNGDIVPVSQFIKKGEIGIPAGAKLFATGDISSKGGNDEDIEFIWRGKRITLSCKPDRHWKAGVEGTKKLWSVGRLLRQEGLRIYKRYFDDFPYREISHVWGDTRGEDDPIYVVQTSMKVIERCILMTSDPGDLVFDPTCGSGTVAHVAERCGRRWITCDTSRVAIALAKQRLMTATFDYYELAHPIEGIASGFKYKNVPHVTLKSIANNEPPDQETLYDQPYVDKSKARVTGPFTVEAVPAPGVKPLDDVQNGHEADDSVARQGPTLRHAEWRSELLKTGIRGKNGQMIMFSRVEPMGGTRYLHADAETKGEKPERVMISFGPEHAPLEQKQVEMAWEEARQLHPKPTMIVFASFQFDPEAAKDIDELTKDKTGMTFLKVQMNTDLLTEDLKKARSNNQSFWLIGQPDIDAKRIKTGEHKGKWQIEVKGFDYYNTQTGSIESGDTSKIAMWMLDPDYDGRSLYPRQVFFPMAGEGDGWDKLAKNLKAEIDPELIEAYKGTESLPFEVGTHKRAAVKIIDARGIESLKLIELA